jgi:hypothetical protein
MRSRQHAAPSQVKNIDVNYKQYSQKNKGNTPDKNNNKVYPDHRENLKTGIRSTSGLSLFPSFLNTSIEITGRGHTLPLVKSSY